MALLALGSVSVASDGVVTKSGEIGALYDLLYADYLVQLAETGVQPPDGARSAATKRGLGRMATTIVTYVHTALTTRANGMISTTDPALQRLPTVPLGNAECIAPADNKYIKIV